jgi:hypothetical protein
VRGGLVNLHNKQFNIKFSSLNIFRDKNCGSFIRRIEGVARMKENVKCRSDKLTDKDHVRAASIVGSLILREFLERNKI